MPLFVDLLSAAKNRLQSCHCTSVAFASKNVELGKKLILTIRAAMLDEKVDLVAGDFNGAALRCDNRNKVFLLTALCQRPLDPHTCGDQDRFRAAGLTCVGSLSRPNPVCIGKYGSTVPFPFLMKHWACARPIKAATTKHGFTSTSSIGKTFSHNVKSTIEGSS